MFPSPPPPPPPPLMDHRRSLGRENGFDGFTVAVCRLKGREKIETRQSKDESKRIARKKEKRKMKDDTWEGTRVGVRTLNAVSWMARRRAGYSSDSARDKEERLRREKRNDEKTERMPKKPRNSSTRRPREEQGKKENERCGSKRTRKN